MKAKLFLLLMSPGLLCGLAAAGPKHHQAYWVMYAILAYMGWKALVLAFKVLAFAFGVIAFPFMVIYYFFHALRSPPAPKGGSLSTESGSPAEQASS